MTLQVEEDVSPVPALRGWGDEDRVLSIMAVCLVLLMFVTVPLQGAHVVFQWVSGILVVTVVALAVIASRNWVTFSLQVIALVLNLIAIVSRLVRGSSSLDIALGATGWLLLGTATIYTVAKLVFRPGDVNYHRIVGAVLIYLMISIVFMALFALTSLAAPGAFTGLPMDDSPALPGSLIYFSFVTLTSTGYGDIVPVHPFARSLCNLETIIGQLYPATLLARLVSLELENRTRR